MLSHRRIITYLLLGAALLVILASMFIRPGKNSDSADQETYQYVFTGRLFCSTCEYQYVELLLRSQNEHADSGTAMLNLTKYYTGKPVGIKEKRNASWTVLRGNASDPDATIMEITDTIGEMTLLLAPPQEPGTKKFHTLTQISESGELLTDSATRKGFLYLKNAGYTIPIE